MFRPLTTRLLDSWPGRQGAEWWESSTTRCERGGMILLALICLTNIFSTALVQTFVVMLTLVVVGCLLSLRPVVFRRTPLDLPYLVFILGRIISLVFSQDPARSFPALYLEYYFYIVFFLVTQSLRRNEITATQVLTMILVGAGAVAALTGTLKVLFSLELRGSSTTAGPYTLGGYLCALLPLALLLPLHDEKRGGGRWQWLAVLAMCVGIVFTYDRIHWTAMALTLVVALVFSRKRMPVIVLCCALLLSLSLPSLRLRVEELVNIGEVTSGRDVLWRGALLLIKEHPLVGFGPRSFGSIFPLFAEMPVRGVGSWHNDYLQVYLDSGLIGLLPLLWLVVATYIHGWRSMRSSAMPPQTRRVIVSLLLSMSVVFLVGGVLDTLVGILFRILLGLFALLVSPPDSPLQASREGMSGARTR